MYQNDLRVRIPERSRSRDSERPSHSRVSEVSGTHAHESQAHHARDGLASADRAESSIQDRHEQDRRCNSQDIFLSIRPDDDIYSWEFGQPHRGAYKTRSEYDRQQNISMEERASNKEQRKRWARLVKARSDSKGLGVLRDYGPYHNSGPALGDLHRALRHGTDPDSAGKWNHDLFENDDVEDPSGGRINADLWQQKHRKESQYVLESMRRGRCLEIKRFGRMRAWVD